MVTNEVNTINIKESMMATIIVLLIALVILDLVALRWGFDSRDEIEGPEWERRRAWKAFH
jgi:hypothetical protein